MAIDYGTQRVGIAVTDPLKIIATALTTIEEKEVMNFLDAYFKKEEVDCVVIGQPLNLNNTNSEMEQKTLVFIKNLQAKFPLLNTKRIDERFTSVIAKKTILDAGIKKMERRNKSLADKVSATLLLQSYLAILNFKP